MKKKNETCSKRIVRAIEESGITRYAIAKETGIDQGTLSRMVNGDGWIGREAFDKLTEHIGVEIVIRPTRKAR